MNIFLCDIVGTYTKSKSAKDRDEEIKEFVKNLEELINNEENNELYFCFLSTCPIEYLIPYITKFEKAIENSNIISHIHFSDTFMYIDGNSIESHHTTKIDQINLLLNKSCGIKNLYYADDCIINQKIIKKTIERKYPYINYYSFIPGLNNEKGLTGLTNLIKVHNKKYNTENKKNISKSQII